MSNINVCDKIFIESLTKEKNGINEIFTSNGWSA